MNAVNGNAPLCYRSRARPSTAASLPQVPPFADGRPDARAVYCSLNCTVTVMITGTGTLFSIVGV